MITNAVSLPSNRFTLSDGFRTCTNGKLFIGKMNTDATVTENQISVFYLNASNVETVLTQPIQLDSIGRPTDNNGNFANVYVKENYSVTVVDAYGVTQLAITDLPIYTAGSFAELRAITPLYAGQVIELKGWNSGSNLGGGEFVAEETSDVDDGGHIAGEGDLKWVRVSPVVNISDFGVFLQPRGVFSALQDMSDNYNASVKRAIKKSSPLISDFIMDKLDFPAYGIIIKKSVHLTGLQSIIGQHCFIASDSEGSYDTDLGRNEPYVIHNMNAKFDSYGKKYYGTNYDVDKIGTITVHNNGSNINPLNGQIHCFKSANIDKLFSSNFSKGIGIDMTSSYDYYATMLGANFSGDATHYAVDCLNYPGSDTADEHNAANVGSILCHDCNERDLRWMGTKNILGNAHIENTRVNVSTPQGGYDFASTNGVGYTNTSLSSPAGSIGTISIAPYGSNTVTHVCSFGVWNNNIDVIVTKGTLSAVGTNNQNGTLGTVTTGSDFLIRTGAFLTVDSVSVGGNLSVNEPLATIRNAIVSGDLTYGAGTISGGQITGNAILHPYGKFTNLTVGSLTVNQGWSGLQYLRNVMVSGDVTISGAVAVLYTHSCRFSGNISIGNGTNWNSDNDYCSKTITMTSTNLNLKLKFFQVNNLIMTGATGTWLFNNVTIGGSLTGWTFPVSSTAVGSICQNPLDGSSQIYSSSKWKVLNSAAS